MQVSVSSVKVPVCGNIHSYGTCISLDVSSNIVKKRYLYQYFKWNLNTLVKRYSCIRLKKKKYYLSCDVTCFDFLNDGTHDDVINSICENKKQKILINDTQFVILVINKNLKKH